MSGIEPIDITVKATLTGKAPLVMHNPRLADPDDEYTLAIAEIAAKKANMTAEDRRRKDDLQWRGSLYTEMIREDGTSEDHERAIVPAMWLTRALEEGGKTLGAGTKSKGAAVFRSVTIGATFITLDYPGPRDIAALSEDPRFRWRTLVNPNPNGGKKGRLPSVRAIFPKWTLTTTLNLVTDMGLSWDDFERAARAAGNVGIGDARKLTYGRFSVKLAKR